MGLFDKFKNHDKNDEAKQEQIDKATEAYEKRNADFEKWVHYDLPDKPDNTEKVDKKNGAVDDTNKGQRERDYPAEQAETKKQEVREQDDDCVR